MKILLIPCCLFVCFIVPALGQEVDPCEVCKPLHLESTISATVEHGPFWLTWLSEFHQIPGRKCFYREVRNNGSRPLYYSWPVGRIPLNVALTSKKRDRLCRFGSENRYPATKGPLYLGREGLPEDTQVWLDQEESETGLSDLIPKALPRIQQVASSVKTQTMPESGRSNNNGIEENLYSPLITSFEMHVSLIQKRRYVFFIPLPRSRRAYSVNLSFASVVAKVHDAYKITNSLVSLNKERAIPAFSFPDTVMEPVTLHGGPSFMQLSLKGGNTVLVDGKETSDGARIYSGSTFETSDQVLATVDMSSGARTVELQPNSKAKLDFEQDGKVQVKVIRGCAAVRKKSGALPGEMELYTDADSLTTNTSRRHIGGCLLPNGQLGSLGSGFTWPHMKGPISRFLKTVGHLLWSGEPDPDLPISGAGGFEHRYAGTVSTQTPSLIHKRFAIKSGAGQEVIIVDLPVWAP